jgi:hypothetical protein
MAISELRDWMIRWDGINRQGPAVLPRRIRRGLIPTR